MAKSCNQKAKILYLERMMWETENAKAVSMQEILARLEGYGIHAERKSIYDDMEALRSFGMDIQYRRGSQGGYYLASRGEADDLQQTMLKKYRGSVSGQEETTACEAIETGEEEAPEKNEEVLQEENVPVIRLNSVSATPHARKLKIIFHNSMRSEVERVLGNDAVYKEKSADSFSVTVRVEEDRMLYGWLASMGKNAHILKPVKAALAYRSFLKNIVKEYKGIEK